jgi:5-methylcytosine-specific restriction endonuclease McrA
MNSLKRLSDKELIGRLRQLIRKERALTLEILPHLAEVDRRELYVRWGYSSLTDYCISHLGYCESKAWRRVCAARVISRFPVVYDLLETEQLTFSAVIAAASTLTPQNKTELLKRIVGKSQSEVKRVAAEYKPPQQIPDQARPTVVVKTSVAEALPVAGASPVGAGEPALPKVGEIPPRSEGKKLTSDERPPKQAISYERMYDIRFAGDEELLELMKWMRSHLSGRYPTGASYQEMFKFALRYVREREDPAKRAERRKKRQTKQKTSKKSAPKAAKSARTRHIPAKEQDKVWVRDKGQCAFMGPGGKRCNATHNLQFDHYPVPYARGGPNIACNLRLLCGKHNRFAAEEVYGKVHMAGYIKLE